MYFTGLGHDGNRFARDLGHLFETAQVCGAVHRADQDGEVLRQRRDLIIHRSLPGRPLVIAHRDS